jgi:DNA-binding phage protein
MKPNRPFSDTTQEMLKDPELAVLYLEECLRDEDIELFTAALKDVADACGGMAYLSYRVEKGIAMLSRIKNKGKV